MADQILDKLPIVLLTLVIFTTTTTVSFPYINQAHAVDCQLTFKLTYEKIHIYDDEDHA